jgi:hypothetical protein
MTRRAVLAAAADIAAVVVFVAIGRRSHDEGEAIDGLFTVAAPFMIALLVGWLVARAWANPLRVSTAFVIWPITVAVGMVLRHFVFDRGTAFSFVVVTAVVTGVFLIGWRMVVARATDPLR